jgi:carbamoyl-phosphate synthase large subunit
MNIANLKAEDTSAQSLKQRGDWTTLRIAITGMNNRPDNPGPGHATARCLRADPRFHGQIIGLGYETLDGGLYDRELCCASYLLPYPSSGEGALLERLLDIHRYCPFDVLIPCLDSELIAFSRLQNQLNAAGIRMLVPSTSQIRQRDKDRLPELGALTRVATPAIRHLTHPGFFNHCEQEGWRYPLVVKGRFYDAVVAHNPAQAVAAFHRLAAEWGLPILAQQFIPGQEFNVCALGDGTGEVLGMVMMRKRALTEKGKAWAGTSIHHPELENAATRLIQELCWPGPLEVEMICDEQGHFHLLEINPRFPAWVFLTAGSGCNLPVRLLQHLNGDLIEGPQQGQAGLTFIRYAMERIVSLDELAEMTLLGGLNTVPAAEDTLITSSHAATNHLINTTF